MNEGNRMIHWCAVATIFAVGCGAPDDFNPGTATQVESTPLTQATPVSCTQESDCPGGLACLANVCQPCAAHSQCQSDVCDQNAATSMGPGRCIAEDSVVYVRAQGGFGCDTGDGSRADPDCDINRGINHAVGQKYAVRVYPGHYFPFGVSNRTVFLFGPADGSAVIGEEDLSTGARIRDGSNVVLDGLDFGVHVITGLICQDSTLKVARATIQGDFNGMRSTDCTLNLDRVRVETLVHAGLTVEGSASYRVTNSYFRGASSPGVVFTGASAGIFEFNTITGGGSTDFPGGIDCGTTPRLIQDSIVVSSVAGDGGAQTVGACDHQRVVVGSADTRAQAGLIKIDPDLDSQGALLETPANAACCIDRGERFASSLYRDVFGTPRPQGQSNDIGAHERPAVLLASADSTVRTDLVALRHDNYGCQPFIEVGSSRGGRDDQFGDPNAIQAVVQFDLSPLTTFPYVQSAVLELTLDGFDQGLPSSVYDVVAHPIFNFGSGWIEGNGVEGDVVPAGCTNVEDAFGVAWFGANEGGDANNQSRPPFDPASITSATISQATAVRGNVFRWDLTTVARHWRTDLLLSPGGILLLDPTGDGSFRGVKFGARDGLLRGFPNAVSGPRLIVTLTPQRL